LVADAVGLDMANYWTASGDTYFKSVPKALIAEAIAEVDAEKAKTVDKLKKGEAVALAEEALKDSKWLPVALRRVTAK
jgi:ParB family chromosome partitioning protein